MTGWDEIEGMPGWWIYLVKSKPHAVAGPGSDGGAFWERYDFDFLEHGSRFIYFERTKTIAEAKLAAERAVWEVDGQD